MRQIATETKAASQRVQRQPATGAPKATAPAKTSAAVPAGVSAAPTLATPAVAGPAVAGPAVADPVVDLLGLQRSIGNRSLLRLLDTQPPSHGVSRVATLTSDRSPSGGTVRREMEAEFTEDPATFMRDNVVVFDYWSGVIGRYPKAYRAALSSVAEPELRTNLQAVMAQVASASAFYLQKAGPTEPGEQSVYYTTPALDRLDEEVLKMLFRSKGAPNPGAAALVRTLKGEAGAEDAPTITAAYVPYKIGNPNLVGDKGALDEDSFENVGHTVIDPAVTSFVFTDSMNGCAYGITGVDGDDVRFEAWHFQSESDNFSQASHFRATKGIREWFGVNDYYIGGGKDNAVATNIIWNSGDEGWKMLSQKNILPVDGTGKVQPKGTAVQALNTGAPIGEERLDEVHDKLATGVRGEIRDDEIAHANAGLAALTLGSAPTMKSLKRINEQAKSMVGTEAAEIDKISGRSGDAQLRRDSDVTDPALFTDMAGLKGELDAITTKGFFGTSYDQARALPLKLRFLSLSARLLSAVSTLAGEAAGSTITNDASQVATDRAVLAKVRKVQYFLDIYEDRAYNTVQIVGNDVSRIITRKVAARNKVDMLAGEKATIFPA